MGLALVSCASDVDGSANVAPAEVDERAETTASTEADGPTLVCQDPAPVEVGLGDSVSSELGGASDTRCFWAEIPEGLSAVTIGLTGMTADLDLFAAYGFLAEVQDPGLGEFWKSTEGDTLDEVVTIENPKPGPYFFTVHNAGPLAPSDFFLSITTTPASTAAPTGMALPSPETCARPSTEIEIGATAASEISAGVTTVADEVLWLNMSSRHSPRPRSARSRIALTLAAALILASCSGDGDGPLHDDNVSTDGQDSEDGSGSDAEDSSATAGEAGPMCEDPPPVEIGAESSTDGEVGAGVGYAKCFAIDVESGLGSMTISLTGLTDDLGLLVGYNDLDTVQFRVGDIWSSANSGPDDESVNIDNPAAGRYYIVVSSGTFRNESAFVLTAETA